MCDHHFDSFLSRAPDLVVGQLDSISFAEDALRHLPRQSGSGLEAAGGKHLEVFSATIGRQLLERGLIDEIDLHIAPVLQCQTSRSRTSGTRSGLDRATCQA
jgi:hypothetical protein